MQTLIQTFIDRRGDLLTALWQHLGISLASLVIAMVIAIPLAIWVVRRPRWAEGLLQLTSVLQTIPSLALLGLLIPLVGVGTVLEVIALVFYAFLQIFQINYLGFSEIDASIEEAHDAFGMYRIGKFFNFKHPLS